MGANRSALWFTVGAVAIAVAAGWVFWSMREVEPGVNLVMEDERSNQDPVWCPRPMPEDQATDVEATP